jgi:hypothetical protein
MSTVVAKLSVSFALFVASCATGTDSVEYTRAEGPVGAGDVGDAASSPRDGALDADVAGPDSASDAAPGADSQVHPLPNEPWRPLGVVYPTPGATATLKLPGDAPTRAALGYLHANCAHCHNDDGTARKDTRLTLRLSVRDVIPGQTTIERNTVGVQADHYATEGLRVQPGRPEASIIVQRMKVRDLSKQMPGLGTERVDRDGLLTIERWIASLVVEEGR